MKILVKYPTRSRPSAFLLRLGEWYAQAKDKDNIYFLVSYDHDDTSMTEEVINQAMAIVPKMIIVKGNSKTKIEACNADVKECPYDWDVCLLISDDMYCSQHGWDTMVRAEMEASYPDTDGSLWFFDGAQRKINTLSCLGRAYFNRFGYIYHPSYASFFCDDEQTAVGVTLNRIKRIDTPIATHQHPAWLGGMPVDQLYRRNNKFWIPDQANYNRRKANGFKD